MGSDTGIEVAKALAGGKPCDDCGKFLHLDLDGNLEDRNFPEWTVWPYRYDGNNWMDVCGVCYGKRMGWEEWIMKKE